MTEPNHCNGNCGSCGGCANATIYLTGDALLLLEILSTYAFLPAAKNQEGHYVLREKETAAIQDPHSTIRTMVKEGYLSADMDHPLKGFSYAAYQDCEKHGSLGLTARGQKLSEYLEIVPVSEE